MPWVLPDCDEFEGLTDREMANDLTPSWVGDYDGA